MLFGFFPYILQTFKQKEKFLLYYFIFLVLYLVRSLGSKNYWVISLLNRRGWWCTFRGLSLFQPFPFWGNSVSHGSRIALLCIVWNLGFYCFNCSVVIDTLHIPGPMFHLHVDAHHVMTQIDYNESLLSWDIDYGLLCQSALLKYGLTAWLLETTDLLCLLASHRHGRIPRQFYDDL